MKQHPISEIESQIIAGKIEAEDVCAKRFMKFCHLCNAFRCSDNRKIDDMDMVYCIGGDSVAKTVWRRRTY